MPSAKPSCYKTLITLPLVTLPLAGGGPGWGSKVADRRRCLL